MHQDRDNDGAYEHHTVFVDKMVFPRFVLPFGANTILTMETNADEVWKYTDTNADGVADKKELFRPTSGARETWNPAGQPVLGDGQLDVQHGQRLPPAMDTEWRPERIDGSQQLAVGRDPGQRRQGVVSGRRRGMPGYFQFPVHYGNFAPPDQFEPDLNIMWGAPILVGDIQAGLPGTRMPDGSLIYATAGAGNDVYRGDRLPKDLLGDYLYGEGRADDAQDRPVKTDGLTQLQNVYPRSEFVRSLDPLFRPVDIDDRSGRDDLHRGHVSRNHRGRGVGKGRDVPPRRSSSTSSTKWSGTAASGVFVRRDRRNRNQPRMLTDTPAQLVAHLSHPNGWWRDTAQQLLVLKQDKTIVPALQRLTRTSKNVVARFHALWTLEGLGALDAALTREVLADPEPRLRILALRASETLYKAGDRSFANDYRALAKDSNVDVVIQAMLTMNVLRVPGTPAVVKAASDANKGRGVQFVAERILNPPAAAGRAGGRGGAPLTADEQTALERGSTIYTELCFSCHGDDGRGTPAPGGAPGSTLAPSLVGSPRVNAHRDYVIKTLLHGLAGPMDGRTYPQVMVAMGTNSDRWIADIASYVRNGFGNSGIVVTTDDVARVRAATAARQKPWTVAELDASLPRLVVPDAAWTVTASHDARPAPQANAEGAYNFIANAAGALSFLGWTTGVAQQAGMWFQIELPAARMLTEITFTSSTAGGGRGGPQAWTFPRRYQVQVSSDGSTWSAPIAEGEGVPGTTAIRFAPVSAKFIRITQTATVSGAPAWSMRLMRLYEAPQ